LTTNTAFLQELKEQYEKEFEIKDDLESKGNNLLTISGVVATLLFGFGSFMVDKFDATYDMLTPVTILLIIGIVGNIISIFWSVISFKISLYKYVMPYDYFFNRDGSANEEHLIEYRDGDDLDVFTNTLVDTYLKCNRHNGLQNKDKAVKVDLAQWFFFGSILIIPIVIGLVLTHLPNSQ
jgi:hypothetical protein